jgi:outer membrane protein assembly factor BamB
MTRITWCCLGLGVLLLLAAWSFRDYATLWRGRWRPLPLQPSLSSEGQNGDWTMWRGNAPRTGVQAQPGPAPSGQVQWQFVNGAGFIASPIAAGDSLYVGDTKGRLYRLHRSNGNVIWQLQELGPLDSSPALAGELLYIGLRDGRLLAIQVVDGAIRWSVETGNPIYASPLVHQGILYISSADGNVYALDAAVALSVGVPLRRDGFILLQRF